MNYYDQIKNRLIDNEIFSRVKDYSKERNKLLTYYEVGKILTEAGNEYGKSIIKQYSNKLMIEVGRKYNERTLRRIRQFYEVFKNENWSTMWTKLNWSHYREVLPLKDNNSIRYYLNEAENNNLTQRELHELIKNETYEKLSKETKDKLINKEETNLIELVPNPIILKNPNNYEVINERLLQQLILEDIPHFLNKMGCGYAFIKNEYRIKIGDNYNYIDLLLYNIKNRCYVVVELKITELKKEHIGQIQVYMNYIDKNTKTIEENNTIGIIICKHNNEYIIGYSSDERIISREYEII